MEYWTLTCLSGVSKQWTGLEWNGILDFDLSVGSIQTLDWTGLDWTGLEWNGMEWNGILDFDLSVGSIQTLDWTGLEWNGILDFDPSGCRRTYCTVLQLLTSLGGGVEETILSLAPSIAGAFDTYC